MPTYIYKCKECDETFEVSQKITDPAEYECTKCGGESNRVFQPAGLIFKGSGFYKTDYSNKSKKTDEPNGKSSQPVAPPCATGACDSSCPAANN